MRDERRVKKDKREEALFTRKRYFVDRVETEQIFVDWIRSISLLYSKLISYSLYSFLDFLALYLNNVSKDERTGGQSNL